MDPHLHRPVLLEEILTLAQELSQPVRHYLDVTLGRGGHLRALLKAHEQLQCYAIDRDQQAIEYAQIEFASLIQQQRLQLQHGNFKDIIAQNSAQLLNWTEQKGFDLILADLGVSSPQLDDAHRGFSFYADGPLDMRMDNTSGQTAAEIVNTWSERDLIQLFKEYGEIRRPERVVAAILRQRRSAPFATTLQLASVIEKTDGWRQKGKHPATLYFLALRLETNQELHDLDKAVRQLIALLSPGGRLFVITFHSLEDRIVKYTIKDSFGMGFAVNKKVIQASRSEQLSNVRARSAKLRVFQRGDRSDGELQTL